MKGVGLLVGMVVGAGRRWRVGKLEGAIEAQAWLTKGDRRRCDETLYATVWAYADMKGKR